MNGIFVTVLQIVLQAYKFVNKTKLPQMLKQVFLDSACLKIVIRVAQQSETDVGSTLMDWSGVNAKMINAFIDNSGFCLNVPLQVPSKDVRNTKTF